MLLATLAIDNILDDATATVVAIVFVVIGIDISVAEF